MTTSSYNLKDIPTPPVEEAYRVLRSNIQFCSLGEEMKSITITSCIPGEGKTTTSINLGISLAKSGKKVLLVDADLRKPMILKHLGSSSHIGLTNHLAGHAKLNDIINKTNFENFFFIPCGPKPPNPAELIGSQRFKDFLEIAKELFDLVIIDTPPLGSVIDGALIAALTDATVIIIKSNSVNHANVQKVKEQLEKANAKVLGVVLNKIGKSDYKNYYNYYQYGDNKQIDKGWFKKLKSVRR